MASSRIKSSKTITMSVNDDIFAQVVGEGGKCQEYG